MSERGSSEGYGIDRRRFLQAIGVAAGVTALGSGASVASASSAGFVDAEALVRRAEDGDWATFNDVELTS